MGVGATEEAGCGCTSAGVGSGGVASMAGFSAGTASSAASFEAGDGLGSMAAGLAGAVGGGGVAASSFGGDPAAGESTGFAGLIDGGATATFSRGRDAKAAGLDRAGLSPSAGAAAVDGVSFGPNAAVGFSGAAVGASTVPANPSDTAAASAAAAACGFELTLGRSLSAGGGDGGSAAATDGGTTDVSCPGGGMLATGASSRGRGAKIAVRSSSPYDQITA